MSSLSPRAAASSRPSPRPRVAPSGLASLAFAGLVGTSAGCTDDTGTKPESEGSSSTTEGDDTTTATGSTTTTTTPTTGATTTTTTTGPTTGSSTGDATCKALLCGAGLCCAADDVCLGDACAPACESGVRCGGDDSLCCAADEVCLGDVCTPPLGPCQDQSDCGPGEYCEALLGQCFPLPDPLGCDIEPDSVAVALEWEWTADQVISTPMVADVDDDGVPDVAVSTTLGGMSYPIGEIVLLDGATGAEKWRIPHNPGGMQFGSHGRSTLAVGDVSGDGVPDIVYVGREEGMTRVSPIHAVDGQGDLLWTSRLPDDTVAKLRVENGAAVLANLDADPEAEIVFGAAILDHDGLLVWNQGGQGGIVGTPLNNGMPIYAGGLATLADLDGDDALELVTGREAWTIDWVDGAPPTVSLSLLWKNVDPNGMGNDGWPAVADLDGDGKPEVVLTAWPQIKVLNGQTGKLWCGIDPTDAACSGSMANEAKRAQPISIKGGNLGGPPTVADYDGDGRPEVAIGGGTAFAVYDFNRPGEEIVKPMNDPMPAPGAMYARWSTPIQDNTSAATGTSAFDFDADGASEVLHQDECYFRIFDGATGTTLVEVRSSTSTIHEYPSIADFDGDGRSEILVGANLSNPEPVAQCTAKDPGYTTRQGVFLYGAQGSRWAPTPRLWTQHSYHVTNADAGGNPPLTEQSNWTVPGLNNFREADHGAVVFNAPDLSVSLAAGQASCPAGLVLVATIHNEGELGVPMGVEARLYEGEDVTGTLIGAQTTAEGILPGGTTQLSWTVPGPPEDAKKTYFVLVDGATEIAECVEDNNSALLTGAHCASG